MGPRCLVSGCFVSLMGGLARTSALPAWVPRRCHRSLRGPCRALTVVWRHTVLVPVRERLGVAVASPNEDVLRHVHYTSLSYCCSPSRGPARLPGRWLRRGGFWPPAVRGAVGLRVYGGWWGGGGTRVPSFRGGGHCSIWGGRASAVPVVPGGQRSLMGSPHSLPRPLLPSRGRHPSVAGARGVRTVPPSPVCPPLGDGAAGGGGTWG